MATIQEICPDFLFETVLAAAFHFHTKADIKRGQNVDVLRNMKS